MDLHNRSPKAEHQQGATRRRTAFAGDYFDCKSVSSFSIDFPPCSFCLPWFQSPLAVCQCTSKKTTSAFSRSGSEVPLRSPTCRHSQQETQASRLFDQQLRESLHQNKVEKLVLLTPLCLTSSSSTSTKYRETQLDTQGCNHTHIWGEHRPINARQGGPLVHYPRPDKHQ